MEAPEWDVFKRIESLEELRPTVGDLTIIAVDTFLLLFGWLAMEHRSGARAFKDRLIAIFEKGGLSKETLNSLQKFMLQVCEKAEK